MCSYMIAPQKKLDNYEDIRGPVMYTHNRFTIVSSIK